MHLPDLEASWEALFPGSLERPSGRWGDWHTGRNVERHTLDEVGLTVANPKDMMISRRFVHDDLQAWHEPSLDCQWTRSPRGLMEKGIASPWRRTLHSPHLGTRGCNPLLLIGTDERF